MGSVLVSLVPYILGSALVPLQAIIHILILKSPRQGVLKALAYVAGMITMRLLQGLVFGLLLADASAASAEQGGGKSPVAATLLMLLGILLLLSAYKTWSKEVDPDDPPPKWLTMIDSLTPLKAFGLGFGLLAISAKLWVFTLSAIAVIGEAQLGQPASTVAYLLFVLLASSLLLLLILIRVLAPKRAGSLLEELSAWLTKNNRPIVITVSLVFGLFFLYTGFSGLLG
jgi:hypothetical protein